MGRPTRGVALSPTLPVLTLITSTLTSKDERPRSNPARRGTTPRSFQLARLRQTYPGTANVCATPEARQPYWLKLTGWPGRGALEVFQVRSSGSGRAPLP